jgi:tetratricopeptide (TPR) repeat protein
MFLRILIIIIFSSYALAEGQSLQKLDSLHRLLQITPKGQAKIDLYEKICWNYLEIKPDLSTAWKYADSMRLLATEMNLKKALFQTEYNYGIIANFQGDYDESLKHLNTFNSYVREQGDSNQLAKGLYHIAMINTHLGNYEKSLALFYRVIAIEETSGGRKKIGTVLGAIAAVYKESKKLPEAISAYKEAAQFFKATKNDLEYGMTLQNMANCFLELKKYDTAKVVYEQALNISEELKNPPLKATVLGNLGNLYEEKNEYDKALPLHEQALAIWRKQNRKRSLTNCLNNLGKSYLKLGRRDEADRHLREAMDLAQEIKSNPLLFEIYSNINALYVEKGDYEKAYHYFSLSTQINDSIHSENSRKQINLLKARFETEKKDKQISLMAKEQEIHEKEAQRQALLNNALVLGLMLLIVVGVLLYYVFRQRILLTTKSNEAKEADFRRQLTELEMKALRAQINPHFLFNCINAINLMIRKGENDEACLYLGKFSKLVRLILENAEASAVTLESEIALIESYIQLEELRFPGKIAYTISVDQSIGSQHTYLPSMVLQPVVENAIWHGIVHKQNDEKGFINIDVKQNGHQLHCTIEDNGVGRAKAEQLRDRSLLNHKSMGMKITEERLRLLSRKPTGQSIEITDLKDSSDHPCGTRVTIHIPISEQND